MLREIADFLFGDSDPKELILDPDVYMCEECDTYKVYYFDPNYHEATEEACDNYWCKNHSKNMSRVSPTQATQFLRDHQDIEDAKERFSDTLVSIREDLRLRRQTN